MPTFDLTVIDRGVVARRLIMLTKGAVLGTDCVIPDHLVRLRPLEAAYSLTFCQASIISRTNLFRIVEHFPEAAKSLHHAAAIYTLKVRRWTSFLLPYPTLSLPALLLPTFAHAHLPSSTSHPQGAFRLSWTLYKREMRRIGIFGARVSSQEVHSGALQYSAGSAVLAAFTGSGQVAAGPSQGMGIDAVAINGRQDRVNKLRHFRNKPRDSLTYGGGGGNHMSTTSFYNHRRAADRAARDEAACNTHAKSFLRRIGTGSTGSSNDSRSASERSIVASFVKKRGKAEMNGKADAGHSRGSKTIAASASAPGMRAAGMLASSLGASPLGMAPKKKVAQLEEIRAPSPAPSSDDEAAAAHPTAAEENESLVGSGDEAFGEGEEIHHELRALKRAEERHAAELSARMDALRAEVKLSVSGVHAKLDGVIGAIALLERGITGLSQGLQGASHPPQHQRPHSPTQHAQPQHAPPMQHSALHHATTAQLRAYSPATEHQQEVARKVDPRRPEVRKPEPRKPEPTRKPEARRQPEVQRERQQQTALRNGEGRGASKGRSASPPTAAAELAAMREARATSVLPPNGKGGRCGYGNSRSQGAADKGSVWDDPAPLAEATRSRDPQSRHHSPEVSRSDFAPLPASRGKPPSPIGSESSYGRGDGGAMAAAGGAAAMVSGAPTAARAKVLVKRRKRDGCLRTATESPEGGDDEPGGGMAAVANGARGGGSPTAHSPPFNGRPAPIPQVPAAIVQGHVSATVPASQNFAVRRDNTQHMTSCMQAGGGRSPDESMEA